LATPIIILSRLLWRLRGLLLILFLIVLGHIWYNDAGRAWESWQQPLQAQAYCPGHPKVPFVPAEQCGGVSSCDRAFLNRGVPVPCPTLP
jgi:hypothetical protein